MLYPDIPSDSICWEVNNKLWETFEQIFNKQNGFKPRPEWTEAEVVQYLDTVEDKEMIKEIFCIEPNFVYKTQGTMSDMYEVNKCTGDYRPYDSNNLYNDINRGYRIILRPAEQHEIEWANRKADHYRYNLRKQFEEEFIS